jgi:hypothetical protein
MSGRPQEGASSVIDALYLIRYFMFPMPWLCYALVIKISCHSLSLLKTQKILAISLN